MTPSAARLAALTVGGGGVWAGLRAMRAHEETRRWPTTTGVVTAREVSRVTAATLGAPGFQYSPVVRYRFVVDGTVVDGGTWYPAAVHRPPRGTKAWAQRLVQQVPDVVCVHYHPQRPAEACLFLVPEWRLAAVTGIAGVVLAAAFLP